MDVLEAIHTRRSIRKFTADPVLEATVERMLEAAMMAPSAGDAQPWQFVVIRDRKLLAQVKAINPYAAMADRAPLGILVCGDLSLEKFEGFWVQDCSAAVQNLLLAAHGLGLGAVWTGIYPMMDRVRGFRELIDLPGHVVPLALVVIGHPAKRPKAKSRFRPERIHQDKWPIAPLPSGEAVS